ncbi:hypothetical protein QVD17_29714 [Tagetes erecta]|uniref:Hydrophobic seed protein domain-containing protein n=1 Tax=Tagetes erecta TaxID=13708 RepID=A0AAD8K0J8_TARER|nr:hypothetical protein QVD17_29714 [Tagetes erecta]
MFFISTATPIALDCVPCSGGGGGVKPPHHHPKPPKNPKPPTHKPPTIHPPTHKPPIILPPIHKPPIITPPIITPPIVTPPVTVPPVLNPPSGGKPGTTPCPPPPFVPTPAATCPIDTLKLGACVDLLGGLVHIGLGDPVVNQCCPVLAGLLELEAAVFACYLWQNTTSWLHLFYLSLISTSHLGIDEFMDKVNIGIKKYLNLFRVFKLGSILT